MFTFSNITSDRTWGSYNNWFAQSQMEWGTIRLGIDDKIEPIQQPSSFILTCEYCGTSARVKDNFSCPACGAPFDMKFVGAMPMMVHKQNPGCPAPLGISEEAMKLYGGGGSGLVSKAEARKKFLNCSSWEL
jgi:hypothetical protein